MGKVAILLGCFAGAFGLTLAADAHAVTCGCLGNVLYHDRPQLAIWGAVLLVAAPLGALAAWTRATPLLAAAAIGVGGASSNAVALERWGGVTDYWRLPSAQVVVSAGDVAIYLGLVGTVLGIVALALRHVRRGGNLRDDVREVLAP
jgi:hypothetical protein